MIPACVKTVNYVIRGASGGWSGGANGGDGMRLSGVIDLSGRTSETVLTIKVGSAGLARASWADDTYRRGASLGGFGGRRQFSGEPGPKVDGGDGGGSTAIFVPADQSGTSRSHEVDFSRALALAAGGAGAANGQQLYWTQPGPDDHVEFSPVSFPGNAYAANAVWTAVSAPYSGFVVNSESSKPVTARNKHTGEVYLEMPGGVAANGTVQGSNTYKSPGSVFGDGGYPSFKPGLAGKNTRNGGHGGDAAYVTNPPDIGRGGGGGGAGWAGGAGGNTYGSDGREWVRYIGSAGGTGSSFYTDRAVENVRLTAAPARDYAGWTWGSPTNHDGDFTLTWEGGAAEQDYQDRV